MKKMVQAAALALMLAPSVILAQDYDAGVRAAKVGDFKTALKEWRPLADQGDARTQSLLGAMYIHGRGVPQDFAEAARWLRMAAQQGEASAQYNLGTMYTNGIFVPQDNSEAIKLFKLAANQGSEMAQLKVGLMYELGKGVPQDFQTAHMWYNIASGNGDEAGGRLRNEIAKLMTPQDVSEAQRRARVCLGSNYQDCD